MDFLSVDTEGTELRILRAYDFSRHRPRLVAVEHNGREVDERELDQLMARHGYERRGSFPTGTPGIGRSREHRRPVRESGGPHQDGERRSLRQTFAWCCEPTTMGGT